MPQTIFPIGLDFLFQGNVGLGPAGSLTIPNNSVGNAQIPAAAGIAASKVANFPVQKDYSQSPGAAGSGTSIAADTKDIHVAGPNATGTAGVIDGVQFAITGALPVAPSSVTIDVKKSTGGGAFASILASTVTLDQTATLNVGVAGSLSATTYTAGDVFRVIVTLTGGGTQGQGLLVGLRLREPVG